MFKIKASILIVCVFILFSWEPLAGQNGSLVEGRVLDEQGHPLEFAGVLLVEPSQSDYTDSAGYFAFQIDPERFPRVTLRISYVGKHTIEKALQALEYTRIQVYTLRESSLALEQVRVTARRVEGVSNSSVIYDRESIDQLQAFSLADVLNTLPGKATAAPELQYVQQLNLRSAATEQFARNNTMGIAIYVDGVRLSNDANMQSKGLGSHGISGSLIGRRNDPEIGNTSYDTPFGGLDLRDIPADNIERIEVVSGVASARYGEQTDGAVILDLQAGETPYRLSTRFNGSSTNVSLSKGFGLGPKWGAVNASVNYLHSNQDPRDKIKVYNRYNGSLMWTRQFTPGLKNTLTAAYSYKIDDAGIDPDDDSRRKTFAISRSLSLRNRTALSLDHLLADKLELSLGYQRGYQETYRQMYFNRNVQAVADKDTTGIYEGYYVPGNYLAFDHVIGEPVNASGNLHLNKRFTTGPVNHTLSIGGGFSFSANKGPGVLIDPERPVTNITGDLSPRPYRFDLVRNIFNTGAYLEDRLSLDLWERELLVTAGLRYDVQNGWGTWQPRINASYRLQGDWSLKLAYGISTKAPPMSYRYPGPVYNDIPLLNVYTGDARESIFLVYTHKWTPDNSLLRPARSDQAELGISLRKSFLSTSLFLYHKKNTDGFGQTPGLTVLDLPVYDYTYEPGQKPVAYETGDTLSYASTPAQQVVNSLHSVNTGVEWVFSTSKIRSLQTSFTLNTVFSHSSYRQDYERIVKVDDSYIQAGGEAWFGIFRPQEYTSWNLVSNFSANTHIPRLGFVLSLVADVFWEQQRKSQANDRLPLGYFGKDLVYYPIDDFDPDHPDYGYLKLPRGNDSDIRQPFTYTNISLRLAKEIKKRIRFTISAFNLLNSRPRFYNPETGQVTRFNTPFSIGSELSIKF